MRRSRVITVWALLIAMLLSGCRPQPVPPEAPQVLLGEPLGQGTPVDLSPDDAWLLVVRGLLEHNECWLVPTGGGEGSKLFEFTSPFFYASFSPDGAHLAWSTGGQIELAAADGSGSRPITSEEVNAGLFAWSPDSQHLVAVLDQRLAVLDLTGQEVADIAAVSFVRGLSWERLANGSERIFYSDFAEEGVAQISSILPSGDDNRVLVPGEIFIVGGERIFYTDPFGQGSLSVANAIDGSEPTTLLPNAVINMSPRPPAFNEVAYVLQGEGFESNLWLLSLSTGASEQLTSGRPILLPLWSSDGRVIFYSAFDYEADELEDPFDVFRQEVR